MNIVSILGLGAIGLGFLLALLTYKLLRQAPVNNVPIYVYQFFCFVLVLIGAGLQYSTILQDQRINTASVHIFNLSEKIVGYKGRISSLEKRLKVVDDELNLAKQDTAQLGSLKGRVSILKLDNDKYKSKVSSLDKRLEKTKDILSSTQQKASQLTRQLNNSILVMKNIAYMIPSSIKKLNSVNEILTGNVCSGGSSGVPIWGGRGTQMAKLSTEVISNLSAAKSSIHTILR
ncbi:MAG: hypothetical protein V7784_03590 [Oceanospirillaceae bacterium]